MNQDEQCSSLGNSSTSWGAKSLESSIIIDRDLLFSAGQFLWTGFDYIGEPTPYHTKSAYLGQIDTCGFPKDSYYFYQSVWTSYKTSPMIHIFPYWDFNEGQLIDIRVCSNAPEIELFFNNVSQGKLRINHTSGKELIGKWQLPYKPGILKAQAYDENGKIIAIEEKHSFYDAQAIVMKPDKTQLKANGRDLVFVEISVIDKNGILVENANNRIQLKVSGAGRLIGIDNGDSTDYDEYKGTSKRLFSGKLLAVIASKTEGGVISLEAESSGLKASVITLKSIECPISCGPVALLNNETSPYNNEIPIRKITLKSLQGNSYNKKNQKFEVIAELSPPNASYSDLEWRVCNDAGITTNLAKVESQGDKAIVTALGDGSFRLRCMCKNGATKVRLISQLEFVSKGLGVKYIDPYDFVSAGLYSSWKGDLSNGNDRGVATSRDEECHIGFTGIDFGDFGSNEITMPIFVLDDQEFKMQIWEGVPYEEKSNILADIIYQKESIWNTYQEETYFLSKKLKGITDIYFVTYRKAHIKGFRFRKLEKAFSLIIATQNNRLYGDSYKLMNDAVEGIGNNVILEFDNMDFGDLGCSKLLVCGRSIGRKNAIQIRFLNEKSEFIQMIEFNQNDAYTEEEFLLEKVTGHCRVSFVFLPGCEFDFKWFQFLSPQTLNDKQEKSV